MLKYVNKADLKTTNFGCFLIRVNNYYIPFCINLFYFNNYPASHVFCCQLSHLFMFYVAYIANNTALLRAF